MNIMFARTFYVTKFNENISADSVKTEPKIIKMRYNN